MLSGCGQPEVSFSKDVMPILQTSCLQCHRPGGKGHMQSGLLLDTYDHLMKGTKYGPVVKAGNGLSSPFNQVLEGRVDKSIRMPHGGKQIPEAQVKIAAGLGGPGRQEQLKRCGVARAPAMGR